MKTNVNGHAKDAPVTYLYRLLPFITWLNWPFWEPKILYKNVAALIFWGQNCLIVAALSISINIIIFLSRGIRWRQAGQPITHTDIFMAPNCTTHYVLRILQTLCTNTLHIARCSLCCILHPNSTAQTLHYAHCINAQYPNCTTHCTLHTSHTLNKTENPSKDALGKTDKRLD